MQLYQLTKYFLQHFFSEHVVFVGGVHCTFRSFGDSVKPRGVVSNFLVAVFCRHLFMKPDGHPDVSKRHYFFSNIDDNLLKHPNEANQLTLVNAFRRSKKARPLHLSNLIFFPIHLENHWFVFVVDIKDLLWVFLDSYYTEEFEYHQNI
uniref:Ubiquitin-like protease family profile domain-containing protein n=1 Tax=Arundo donax TaxID=35708 RepID=A0A0A8ZYN5_ARUDO